MQLGVLDLPAERNPRPRRSLFPLMMLGSLDFYVVTRFVLLIRFLKIKAKLQIPKFKGCV